MMEIPQAWEWDESKRQSNIEKHGIDFADLGLIFTHPAELLVLGGLTSVNNENITRVSLKEWEQMKGQTDWLKIDSLSEQEIEENAWSDPDNQPLPDEFWEDAIVVLPSENLIVH